MSSLSKIVFCKVYQSSWKYQVLHIVRLALNNNHSHHYLQFQKNQYLDRYIPGSSTCSTKELSITMTKILHAVKGGLLSYCDKVYSRGNINQVEQVEERGNIPV
jgi:hypothetical protein